MIFTDFKTSYPTWKTDVCPTLGDAGVHPLDVVVAAGLFQARALAVVVFVEGLLRTISTGATAAQQLQNFVDVFDMLDVFQFQATILVLQLLPNVLDLLDDEGICLQDVEGGWRQGQRTVGLSWTWNAVDTLL